MVRVITHGHAKATLVLGIIEVILGVAILILSFLLTSNSKDMTALSPYSCGAICLVGGFIGIGVGLKKNRCAMIAFLIVNIIMTILQTAFSIFGLIVLRILQAVGYHVDKYCDYDEKRHVCVCNVYGSQVDYNGLEECDIISKLVTWLFTLVILTAISAILALSISIFSCVALCCTQSVNLEPVVIEQHPLQEK